MQRQQPWILSLPLLLLAACGTGRSSDVKQSTIEQSYELNYNEATTELQALASFHYENTLGTTLKLTDKSSISFNGSAMSYSNPLNAASYHLEMPLTRMPPGPMEFRYVNNDGETFVTQARVPSATVIKIPHEGESVRGDRELPVLMQGDPLIGSDELTLCLVAKATSAAEPETRECLHSDGPLSLVFSREQLARFPSGRELSLEIKRESHPDQNHPRIHLSQSYIAKPVHISLQ